MRPQLNRHTKLGKIGATLGGVTLNSTNKLCALVAVITLAAACGNNDPNNDNVKIDPNNGTADMGDGDTGTGGGDDDMGSTDPDMNVDPDMMVDPDMGDPDMGGEVMCGAEVCGPGEACEANKCVIVDSCATALDLGVLEPGTPREVVGSLIQDGATDLEATCAGATSLRDRAISFELTAPALVSYSAHWNGQFDGVVEFRTDCESSQSAVFCSDNEAQELLLDAGTYFVVLDQKLGNAGGFDITLEATATQCAGDVCSGNDVVLCDDPTAPETLSCAASCSAGACEGSVCTAPILVTAPGRVYTGDGQAHGSDYNFGQNTGCVDENTPGAIETPGFDVVFYVPNLTVGDIISVDAQTNDTNVNSVFIMKSCGDTGVCSAAFRAENPAWIVDEAGSYYVIVDKRLAGAAPFSYKVEIF